MEPLSNYPEDHPSQHKNSHKLCNEMQYPILSLLESQWKQATAWPEFSNGRKVIVEQILASEEMNKSKRARLWESQSRICVGKVTIWVSSFEIAKFTRYTSSTRIGDPVLTTDIKVTKDKHSRWVDRENLIYVRWNRIKNCALQRRWLIEEKEVRNWVK